MTCKTTWGWYLSLKKRRPFHPRRRSLFQEMAKARNWHSPKRENGETMGTTGKTIGIISILNAGRVCYDIDLCPNS